MRNSKILAKIRSGQAAKVAQIGHFLPPFVAYAAHSGYDGLWIDLEHRPFDTREVQALLTLCHMYDIDGMIRPATRDKAPLYRYLEDGAAGLMVPQVADADEVRDLVRKVKFPPVGDRGVHGGGLEASYGLDTRGGRDALVAHALRETFLFVQIETPAALAQAQAMAAVPGVDGLFVGPADLGIRMVLEAQPTPYSDALAQVAAICREQGIAWGTMPRTVAELQEEIALGANLLVWGQDASMLLAGLQRASGEIDSNL